MNTKRIKVIYFSPTQTTEKIVEKLVAAIPNSEVEFNNITLLADRIKSPEKCTQDLVVIASPVYSGLAPKLFVDYLEKVKGEDTKVVVLAVYGNRSAGETCRQISELTTKNGFKTIAAAEFIGEHSFSDQEYPIAPGRPDTDDLNLAHMLGLKVSELLLMDSKAIDPEVLGAKPEQPKEILFTPPTVTDLCNDCGDCAAVCPVDIIATGGTECIGCGACVRICTKNARVFPEKINQYQIKLNANCQARIEPKIFL